MLFQLTEGRNSDFNVNRHHQEASVKIKPRRPWSSRLSVNQNFCFRPAAACIEISPCFGDRDSNAIFAGALPTPSGNGGARKEFRSSKSPPNWASPSPPSANGNAASGFPPDRILNCWSPTPASRLTICSVPWPAPLPQWQMSPQKIAEGLTPPKNRSTKSRKRVLACPRHVPKIHFC